MIDFCAMVLFSNIYVIQENIDKPWMNYRPLKTVLRFIFFI